MMPALTVRRLLAVACLGLCCAVLSACAAKPDPTEDAADEKAAASQAAPQAVAVEARSPDDADAGNTATPTQAAADVAAIVFLGDSLTAGFGLDVEQAFPFLIEQLLTAEGRSVRVVNGGVSGDTTAGGLRRLDWLLKQQPDVVVVALGGNDGLRGLELGASEDNLRQIIERAQQAGAEVLLAGMQIPPNYGQEYIEAFRAIYPRLAAELKVPLIPFLLDDVGGDPDLNQADGIHPTAAGQEIVARTVLEHLRPLLH